uniref:SH2 domain-containing adapter protein D n=1 Tax=Dendroctonus ponderosae TaxID=77166 RepID=A0AAR5PV66_DENPD
MIYGIHLNPAVLVNEKSISLCEDYSLPADHLAELAKRRPNSIAVSNNCFLSQNFSDLIVSSPEADHVVVLDTYSNPRDSQQHLTQEEKYFTSPDKEYSQPYTTEESSNPTSDEEFAYPTGPGFTVEELNSPDSINEGAPQQAILDALSPTKTDILTARRHPSPYYYGDLFKYKTDHPPQSSKAAYSSVVKHQTHKEQGSKGEGHKKSKHSKKHRKGETNEAKERDKVARNRPQLRQHKKSSSIDSHSTSSRDASNDPRERRRTSKTLNVLSCNDDGLDDMTRQRHVYETAFDCRISKSDDDLDQISRVTNHPVLIQWNSDKGGSEPTKGSSSTLHRSPKSNMHLVSEETSSSLGGLLLCGYTPSPPSTAPLPSKFPGKELMMNSIRSAPNLPLRTRLKDLNLPVKTLRSRSPGIASGSLQKRQGSAFDIEFGSTSNSNPHISEFKGRPGNSREQTGDMERVTEIKSRPKPNLLMVPKRMKDNVIRRHKYSSTESMTTSSSGGSMESIKSSTSEGNRSTSSSSSRQSASLSSHSSDSGTGRPKNYPATQSNFLTQQAGNKLHILSPISDKSSQEPISETSDNNRNNNSQKGSPEGHNDPVPEIKTNKKRLPQNKNLLSLNFHRPEIQGSDSGISIQSREGVNKSRYALVTTELSAPPSRQDFSDLPFDMPKLRRCRLIPDTVCTSGSATSIDLRDLPFDMPKLRRRMRLQAGNLEDSVSQASSSQSVVGIERGQLRPKLTLNLGDAGNRKRPGLGLTLTGIGTNEGASTSTQCNTLHFSSCDNIDTDQPLEKQGWFHGSITRVEAENVLRTLREGSFLVRNSESIKNDYSLSLKSARGFMHMRIQKNSENGCFILGQFSKPFLSIPEMIKHFSMNRLPIRGAEHMCLLQPVIAQLL